MNGSQIISLVQEYGSAMLKYVKTGNEADFIKAANIQAELCDNIHALDMDARMWRHHQKQLKVNSGEAESI